MRHPRLRVLASAAAAFAVSLGLLASAAPTASAVGDRDCGDFASQRAAQIFFLNHGGPQSDPHGLDGSDNDGRACESNPAPYYYGSTVPGSNPDPKPKRVTVKSTVSLAMNRAQAIAGEKVRLAATVKPRGVRSVAYQWKPGRHWRTFHRANTNRRGKDAVAIRTPRRTADFRAVLLKKKVGNKTFTGDTSNSRKLAVQKQSVRLVLSDNRVVEGDRVTATAIASPVRRGRSMLLQARQGGRWQTIDSGSQDRRGRKTFRVSTRDDDVTQYRAVVRAARGAASKQSASRELVVLDVTKPDMPTDVVVTSYDSAADASWTPVSDRDPVTYTVRYRAVGTVTWFLEDVADEYVLLSGLTNDTSYELQVRSVDPSGNRSEWTLVQTVTPMAPIEG